MQEDRERMVVRRFMFEDPRIEQIQDLEVLKFLPELLETLKIEGYSLTVSEVAMFLPCLVEKVCVNNYDSYTSPVDILVSAIPFCVLIKFGEFLVEYSIQSGHNIEKVREKMQELTKQFVVVCSASKCFPYILEGLRSKNNRTRIECADLIGFILDHHAAEISGQLKSLQIVASLTAERDGEIRKAD
ncbi:protein MOR1 [Trifolium repens]|nr:protein MOR1 [Trifolium repens]